MSSQRLDPRHPTAGCVVVVLLTNPLHSAHRFPCGGSGFPRAAVQDRGANPRSGWPRSEPPFLGEILKTPNPGNRDRSNPVLLSNARRVSGSTGKKVDRWPD